MTIQTYWLEPTDQVLLGLHRYDISEGSGLNCETGYHSAVNWVDRIPARRDARGYLENVHAHDYDEGWPETCQRCGHTFSFRSKRNVLQEQIFIRSDTGAEETVRRGESFHSGIVTASTGACWDAFWMPDYLKGPDGLALVVRLPYDHDWHVDAKASNCTMPEDHEHQCWVRHGDPRECRVTVDKDGTTCAAGAGSIATGQWHGFLREGVLVE